MIAVAFFFGARGPWGGEAARRVHPRLAEQGERRPCQRVRGAGGRAALRRARAGRLRGRLARAGGEEGPGAPALVRGLVKVRVRGRCPGAEQGSSSIVRLNISEKTDE